MASKSSRRDFLRISSMTSVGMLTIPSTVISNVIPTLKHPGKKKKIIIVGAGLAGLSAGYQLTKVGHEVTVLEAQMQPGGRVRTMRSPFAEDFYAEVGAGRFPKTHELTMGFVKKFGLEIIPFYPESGNLVTYIGKSHLYNSYKEARDTTKVNLPLTNEERQLGEGGLFKKYVLPILSGIGDPTQTSWMNAELLSLDQISWTDFLIQRGMSPAAINFFNVGSASIEDGKEISALWILRDILSGGSKYKIKGGNDQLPKAFSRNLGSKVHYGCVAKRIEQSETNVRVFYESGVHAESISADYLVVAVPFSVMKNIDITPALSTNKDRLMQDLTYGSASRITLQFRKRSWESHGLNGFGTSDDPLQLWHPTFDQTGERGVLQAYLRLSLSRKLARLKEADRVNFVLNKMEMIIPNIRKDFEGGLAKCWDEDPWALGAAAVHAPGQLTDMEHKFDQPEHRIYFAGEHLSPWPAWMQGALYSGLKVAKQINDV